MFRPRLARPLVNCVRVPARFITRRIYRLETQADLMVRRLPHGCTEADLRRAFEGVRDIVSMEIPLNKKGESRGYAFVTISIVEGEYFNDKFRRLDTLENVYVGVRRLVIEMDSPDNRQQTAHDADLKDKRRKKPDQMREAAAAMRKRGGPKPLIGPGCGLYIY
ncbi:hypothetical protein M885DRAFT_562865 [Pelagophyceae sp. CCMP2097]|nr:hypothetical protein M885DRAFT_562865 [Pelagophyceae sp. CCMP2097]